MLFLIDVIRESLLVGAFAPAVGRSVERRLEAALLAGLFCDQAEIRVGRHVICSLQKFSQRGRYRPVIHEMLSALPWLFAPLLPTGHSKAILADFYKIFQRFFTLYLLLDIQGRFEPIFLRFFQKNLPLYFLLDIRRRFDHLF